jgi:hypothetical protein
MPPQMERTLAASAGAPVAVVAVPNCLMNPVLAMIVFVMEIWKPLVAVVSSDGFGEGKHTRHRQKRPRTVRQP